jgi:hypothetical protein
MPVLVEIGRHRTTGHEVSPGLILTQRDDDADDHAMARVDGEPAIVAYDDANFGIQILALPQRLRRQAAVRFDPGMILGVVGNAAAARRVMAVMPSLQAAWTH